MTVAVVGHNTCGHHYLGMSVSYLQYLLTCFHVLVFLDVLWILMSILSSELIMDLCISSISTFTGSY